jgi:glucose-6-phosphate isomerase
MDIRFDYNNMMRSGIGGRGITDAEIDADAARIERARAEVLANRGKGWQEWTELPFADEKELDALIAYADGIRKAADSFVVFGIGGSALGPLAVASAILHMRHNELPASKRKSPKFYVEDNVDPDRMNSLLDIIDLKTSYFNVITKSGETSETLAQFMIVYDALKKTLGAAEAKKRIIVTTTIGKGTLYALAVKEGFKTFGIGGGVGGRFSVLSNVGLVPFAVLGLDVKSLLKGAADMAKLSAVADARKNPALLTAYLQVKAMESGKNISVMMPYADSLKYMSDFYCQLWGESLGKAADKTGKTVNVGQTPVKSLGVTDQHSQVQLYNEGPYDKVITLLAVDEYKTKRVIPADGDIDACGFLKNRTMNELISFERLATEYALKKAGRANFTVTLPKADEYNIGGLLMYFMYQTAFAGALLNIDAYNQPGVEEGKKATFAMFNREGYAEKLAEIKAAVKNPAYVIGKETVCG